MWTHIFVSNITFRHQHNLYSLLITANRRSRIFLNHVLAHSALYAQKSEDQHPLHLLVRVPLKGHLLMI